MLQDKEHCKNLWATGFFLPTKKANGKEVTLIE